MKKKIDIFAGARDCHKIWHKFSGYIVRKYGADLHGEWQYMDVKGKKLRYRSFDNQELSRRLVGYEVMTAISRWVKRYCSEIQIVSCDDSVYAGSDILLIPHPKHGITIIFIPQCTTIQNQFFLYSSHYKEFIKKLTEMKSVYKNSL